MKQAAAVAAPVRGFNAIASREHHPGDGWTRNTPPQSRGARLAHHDNVAGAAVPHLATFLRAEPCRDVGRVPAQEQ